MDDTTRSGKPGTADPASPGAASPGDRGPALSSAAAAGADARAADGPTDASPAWLGPDLRVRAPTPRVALVIVAAVAVVALLYAGRDVLAPFVLGVFLVFLLDPPVEWMARRGIRRAWAILLVYLAIVLVLAILVALAAAPLIAQVRKLVDELPGLVTTLREQVIALLEMLGAPPELVANIKDTLSHLDQVVAGLDPATLMPFVNSIFSAIGSIVAFLIVPFWVFYVVKDRPTITRGLDAGIPEAWRADVRQVAAIVQDVLGRWIRGQLILGSAVGGATLVGLIALGVFVDPVFARFAIVLAVIAGVLEMLPIIGPILSAIPAVILAATVSPAALVAVLLLYLGIQQLENTFLVPKIQGDAVDLHPAAILFVIVLGGAVYGLLGAILAIPIAAASRDVYRHFFRRLSEPASPLARAIAGHPAATAITTGDAPPAP
jgi:predicted PurR-regulated permease PerM